MPAECAKLGFFVEGELTQAESEAFRRHLAGCADCASNLVDLDEQRARRAKKAHQIDLAEDTDDIPF